MIDGLRGVGPNQYRSQLQRYGSQGCVVAVKDLLGKIDTNGDGSVSKAEYRAAFRSSTESSTESRFTGSVLGSQTDLTPSLLHLLQKTWQNGASQKAPPITQPQTADQAISKVDSNGEGVIGMDELGKTRAEVHRYYSRHSGQTSNETGRTGSQISVA